MTTDYRPDIDGLRALAVLPVLFFHARFEAFSGGFVGVDVFFVVSGYLITSIIAKELAAGSFSIISFYERRARRILPALTAVMAFCVLAASLLFLPKEFKEFGDSVGAAALFSSNILFWQQAGYFDAPAELKLLLHTWSLAVEEQFYIFFPLLMYAVHRWLRGKWHVILLPLFAASIVASIYGVTRAPVATFYLAPTRAWELLLGSLLALNLFPLARGRVVREAAAAAGVAFIAWAVFTFTAQTPFPGTHAVIPCAGAALVIWSGMHGQTLTGAALGLRPIVFVGLISYSLYLWHWPLLVFARYWIGQLSTAQTIAILAASFVIAVASWKYVERPVRSRRVLGPRRQLLPAALVSSVLAALAGLGIHASEGWPGRIDEEIRAMAALEDKFHEGRECHGAAATSDAELCVRGAAVDKVRFLLVGDSHADALNPTIFEVARTHGLAGIQFTDPGFRPTKGYWRAESARRDRELVARLESLIARHEPPLVIVAGFWRDALGKIYYDPRGQVGPATALTRGLTSLVTQFPKTRFVILQDVPTSPAFAPGMIARARHLGRPVDQTIPLADYVAQTHSYDALLRELDMQHENVDVIELGQYFCDARRCHGAFDGEPIYRNEDHLSPAGARRLAPLYDKLFRELRAGDENRR